MIQVITHNGRMPSQGGLRIGYLVDGATVVLIGQSGTYTIDQALEILGIKKPKPKINFSNLPFPTHGDGDCPKCGNWRNNRVENMETDIGEKRVLICNQCGQIMRPYERMRN